MRSPRPWLAVAFASVVLFATLPAHADDTEEIRRLDKEVTVATWTADADWFEENLADDYVLVTAAGVTRSKRDVIGELAAPVKMDPFDAADVQIRVYGNAAVATGVVQQRWSVAGSRYSRDLRYTDVYVKRRGRWILVHTANVAVRR
jgi:uncharacterized protein (TIGR02246 family)